jgi:glycine cleavage system H protein
VECPNVGKSFDEGGRVVTIESVKAVADVYSPSQATLVALNKSVIENPDQINKNPHSSWIFEVTCSKAPNNLISKEEYEKFLKEEEAKH